jgi:hypothetical protein
MTDERYERLESHDEDQWILYTILITQEDVGTLTHNIYSNPRLSQRVMVQILPLEKFKGMSDYLRRESLSKTLAELCSLRSEYRQELRRIEGQIACFGFIPPTESHLMHQPERKRLAGLRQVLTKRFDEGGLRTFCFDLGVDYDDLLGEGKADKARELVSYLERRDRIPELVEIGKKTRPDILWEDILSADGEAQLGSQGAQLESLQYQKEQLKADLQEIERQISELAGSPEQACQ